MIKNEMISKMIARIITIEVLIKDSHLPYSRFSQIIVDGSGALVAVSQYFSKNFFFLIMNLPRSFKHLILSSMSSNITNA